MLDLETVALVLAMSIAQTANSVPAIFGDRSFQEMKVRKCP